MTALSEIYFAATHQFRLLLRSRRTLLIVTGLALTSLLAFLSVAESQPMQHFAPLSVLLVLAVLTPLAGLLLGSTVIAEEVEARTLTYVFTRPISRVNLFLGRWLACTLMVCLLLGLFAWLIGAHAASFETEADGPLWKRAVPSGVVARFVYATLLGGAIFTGLSAWLSTCMRRPIITGLGYAFVWEMVVGNLPGSTQRLSIQYYLRGILFGPDTEAFHLPRNMLTMEYLSPSESAMRLGIALAIMLVIGALVVRRKQYLLSS